MAVISPVVPISGITIVLEDETAVGPASERTSVSEGRPVGVSSAVDGVPVAIRDGREARSPDFTELQLNSLLTSASMDMSIRPAGGWISPYLSKLLRLQLARRLPVKRLFGPRLCGRGLRLNKSLAGLGW